MKKGERVIERKRVQRVVERGTERKTRKTISANCCREIFDNFIALLIR